ncbi:MAG: hypothetical protein GY750_21175 [Lentisphaerae bacterium]|nr:hypothetical protein [Lentisphaerota bacterium]
MPVQHAIFIHPALDRDWEPVGYSSVKRIDVYYSENDSATRTARYLPFHNWGAMGTTGPTSDSEIFHRHNDGLEHSDGFIKCPDLFIESLRDITISAHA